MRHALYLSLVTVGVMLAAVPSAGAVAVSTLSTYYFSGVCSDCSKSETGEFTPVNVTGQLTLVNYDRNTPLMAANFVSFHYDGSDAIPGGFTLVDGGDLKIGGSISDTLPRPEDFYVIGTLLGTLNHQLFQTFSTGRWCTGYSCLDSYDTGTEHTWNATPAATVVPEPMSLVLLGSGILGVAALRRRA